jgi:hypothetical protein
MFVRRGRRVVNDGDPPGAPIDRARRVGQRWRFVLDGVTTAELPSTSGRGWVRLRLTGSPGQRSLSLRYRTSIYGRDIEPVEHWTETPQFAVTEAALVGLLEGVRGYGEVMVSRESQGSGMSVHLSERPRVAFEFTPSPGLGGWQANVRFRYIDTTLSIEGGFPLDATCLDLFAEDLAAVVEPDA